jgi:hypothetical protein
MTNIQAKLAGESSLVLIVDHHLLVRDCSMDSVAKVVESVSVFL